MNKTALKKLKTLLLSNYSNLIDRIILFGSRATGSASKNSDYDILLVLNQDHDWRLENKILDLCYEIDLKHNILTDIKIISKSDLDTIKCRQPYILKALESGVHL